MTTSVSTTCTLDRLNMLIKQNKQNRLQEEYLLLEVVDDSVMERFPKAKLRSSRSLSMSSINGSGRLRLARRRWRRDATPLDLVGRRAVTKFGSSRTKSASQKPYSSSPDAGSQRQRFRRPARPVAGARKQSDRSLGDDGATVSKGKTLFVDSVCFSVSGGLLI
jgi:hypothetical protein